MKKRYNLLSYSKTMLISLLVLLLFSNAVTIRRDKSILFSKIVISSLILTLTDDSYLNIIILFTSILLELLCYFSFIKQYLLHIISIYYKFKFFFKLFNYLYKGVNNYLCAFFLLILLYSILVNSFLITALFILVNFSFLALIYLLFLDRYLHKYNNKLHKKLIFLFLVIFIISLFMLLLLIGISLFKLIYDIIVFIKTSQKTSKGNTPNNNNDFNNNKNNNTSNDNIINKDIEKKKKKAAESKKYRSSSKGKATIAAYRAGQKYKANQKKYRQSDKGILARAAAKNKYRSSEKGKLNAEKSKADLREKYWKNKQKLEEIRDKEDAADAIKFLQESTRGYN
uniref:Uncharacterized protein n=1 Tax=Pseudocercospora mori TaxID=1341201 RepID=A0A2L1K2L7_9PEZI|nr:hypothetical protein [Pseudocercospora mori]AVE15083.1 hypothetical protein [Pseudocercospora mori]